MNCYVNSAHGRVPTEILLGRKLYMPSEIKHLDIDVETGNTLAHPF